VLDIWRRLSPGTKHRALAISIAVVLTADLHALERALATPPEWAVRCSPGEVLPPVAQPADVTVRVQVLTPAPVAGELIRLSLVIENRGTQRLRVRVPAAPRAVYVALVQPGQRNVMAGPRYLGTSSETRREVDPGHALRLAAELEASPCRASAGTHAPSLPAGFYEVVGGVRLATWTGEDAYALSQPVGLVLGPTR
jgi:hypothetical protein